MIAFSGGVAQSLEELVGCVMHPAVKDRKWSDIRNDKAGARLGEAPRPECAISNQVHHRAVAV